MSFWKTEFDKLLLTALLLMFCGLLVWATKANGPMAAFASDQAKVFGGALLGLITGRAMASTDALKSPKSPVPQENNSPESHDEPQ